MDAPACEEEQPPALLWVRGGVALSVLFNTVWHAAAVERVTPTRLKA